MLSTYQNKKGIEKFLVAWCPVGHLLSFFNCWLSSYSFSRLSNNIILKGFLYFHVKISSVLKLHGPFGYFPEVWRQLLYRLQSICVGSFIWPGIHTQVQGTTALGLIRQTMLYYFCTCPGPTHCTYSGLIHSTIGPGHFNFLVPNLLNGTGGFHLIYL